MDPDTDNIFLHLNWTENIHQGICLKFFGHPIYQLTFILSVQSIISPQIESFFSSRYDDLSAAADLSAWGIRPPAAEPVAPGVLAGRTIGGGDAPWSPRNRTRDREVR